MQKLAQRRNAPTSRHHNVATFQCLDVAGKSQQTLSLGEAIKGTGESNVRVSKFVCRAKV